ncbi:MAG: hypothetical protein DVB23_000429 [Verrucomicrobia bacterium]|jgi:hypothetical protein|nr:MAG: hypothetical protein DVB23_000429 [Verrucomicrobiota bacterium]
MPRRSRHSSGANTNQILGLVGGLLFILLVGAVVAFLLLGDGGSPRRSVRAAAATEFSLRDYLDNANSLRGNTYRVDGTVEEQLRWTRDRGRLISLHVDGTSEGSPVPILVPQDFSHVSIEKNTDLTFVAEVGDNGLLVARDVRPK